MAFIGVDDLVSEISAGKIHRSDWFYKVGTASGSAGGNVGAGINLSSFPGQFGAGNNFDGTALNWVTCNDASGNGSRIFGIPHGGNVSPDKKHLISASAIHPLVAASNAVPIVGGNLILADLQGYWPGISHATTTTQNLLGTPSLRYTNGDGCRLYNVVTSALAATVHNITISYRNQLNNTSSAGPNAVRTLAQIGQILNLAAGSGLYAPLVNGDTGVQNVNSITMSAASTGTSALCLARPLIHVPLVGGSYIVTEREFVNQTPSMPEIKDGACLIWLYVSAIGSSSSSVGGNAGNFNGHIETAWG
jgi:hypothetical protein